MRVGIKMLGFFLILSAIGSVQAQEKKRWWQTLGSSSNEPKENTRTSDYFSNSRPLLSFPSLPFSGKDKESKPAVQFAGGNGSTPSKTQEGAKEGPVMFAAASSLLGKGGQGVSRSWKRMTNTGRNAWNQTTDFLNPFNNRPEPIPKQNMGYQPQRETPPKKGMFSWLAPAPPPQGDPADVGDFLRMSRPKF